MALKIVTLNCNGLNHPVKRASLWQMAKAQSCSILCVQEMHFKASATPPCSHRDFPHIFKALGPKKTKGVMIAIHKSVLFQLQECIPDAAGRFLILVSTINHVGVSVCP